MTQTTLRVPVSNQAPRISRTHINEIRDQLGTRFDDVTLIISELVSNSVRHTGVDDGVVRVDVQVDERVIRLEVNDPGPGFDKDAPRGDGMGLNIVESLAQRWGIIADGGCTVWAELALTT